MSFPTFIGSTGFLVDCSNCNHLFQLLKLIFPMEQLIYANVLKHFLKIFTAQILARSSGKGSWELLVENCYWIGWFWGFFPAKIIQLSQKNFAKGGKKPFAVKK